VRLSKRILSQSQALVDRTADDVAVGRNGGARSAGVRQTLAEALKPENVARAAAANSVSEDQRIEQWIEHHATCLAQPEATEPNADCLRESALSASSVSGANGRLEAHTISFDSVLSVPPPPLSSSPDGGGGGGDHGDERVAVWQHEDAYTMLHVTTAIPRTLALGHIAFRLNASDVAVVQVAVKAVGMEPCRSPPDAGTTLHPSSSSVVFHAASTMPRALATGRCAWNLRFARTA